HDIGKMFIPDELLHKPGPLSEPERDLARKHVQAGVQLLRRIERLPAPAIDVARYHHERYDGSGYPHQLRQNQ
ncbi:MAG: HD domain-containing protein, partial [Gammaproteobacteria bacterium]|nr:HD domain-containing protein [Gammaproteobacteria bacterium]